MIVVVFMGQEINCDRYDYPENMDNDRLVLIYWCEKHNDEMSPEEYHELRYG